MSARLLDDAVPRIDQHDGHVGRRCASDHVARVLLVAWRVGDDEVALRGGEVAVGHVDGDALLAFGAQAIGQQRQVHLAVAVAATGARHCRQLVFEHRLGVVQQSADERALAVVDRSGGGDAQGGQAAHQK